MANSLIGKALEMLAEQAAVGLSWDTDPIAKWYPDFEVNVLKSQGLTGFVLPETADYLPESRQQKPTQKANVFFAVMHPIEAGSFAEGDVVVARAEALEAKFYRRSFSDGSIAVACTDARLEPAVSAEYAKQFNMWCAILKMELIVL